MLLPVEPNLVLDVASAAIISPLCLHTEFVFGSLVADLLTLIHELR